MKISNYVAKDQQKRWLFTALSGVVFLVIIFLVVWLIPRYRKVQQPTTTPVVAVLKEPKIKLELLVAGLKSPTSIVAPSSQADKRIFVLEQGGQIRIIDDSSQLVTRSFMDIGQRVLNSGEMGLLGLSFHPDYASNGYFYVNYVNKSQETVIARYSVSTDANIADSSSEKVLIKFKQPYTNHNGGDLKFGPDGFLYIALGDGGSAGDPENRAQNNNTLLGKILRVDVNNGDPYSIPTTNPFIDKAGTQPEIWASGLRNPWRISFDSANGDLYIADVGQGTTEEVNVQKPGSPGGLNYGWRCFEGNKPFNLQACKGADSYVAPVLEYTHAEGRCSITGGSVYRGSLYPTLAGKYFYGDFCNGQLFYVEEKENKWQPTLVEKTPYSFSTFGQDSNKELYVADYSTGSIYKITDTAN